jgi:hypothetical protein
MTGTADFAVLARRQRRKSNKRTATENKTLLAMLQFNAIACARNVYMPS